MTDLVIAPHPHGHHCIDCGESLPEGEPYPKRLVAIDDNGDLELTGGDGIVYSVEAICRSCSGEDTE